MEFDFMFRRVGEVDDDGYLILEGVKLPNKSKASKSIVRVIEDMGQASSQAQGLKSTITTYDRLLSPDIKLYMKVEGNKALGFIKIGVKQLFHRDLLGNIKKINPLCVLDFYVHESLQRCGIGKQIFEKMLGLEGKNPENLAIDRPSQKFLNFLKKHYGLVNYIPQNNNFVIFQQYFEPPRPRSKGNRETLAKMGRLVMDEKKPDEKKENSIKKGDFDQPQSKKENLYRKEDDHNQKFEKIIQKERKPNDIEGKIELAEKNLAEVEERLRSMRIGSDREQDNAGYLVRPPWATNCPTYSNQSSSSSYGRHYFSKMYRR